MAPGQKARVGAIVYVAALLLQFGASAMYHLGDWSDPAYLRMRRLDHTMIFVLIAGTYTPICLVALHGTASWLVLTLAWTGAAVGILTKLYRIDLHRLSGIMYIGLGWLAVFVLAGAGAIAGCGGPRCWWWRAGLLYTLGALVARHASSRPVARDLRVPRGLAHVHDPGGGLPLHGDPVLLYLGRAEVRSGPTAAP